jgi:oligoendopeptidase F
VTTLAHEVGHAWHGHLLRAMRPFARHYPMTLAETASIFAEHILIEGLGRDPGSTSAETPPAGCRRLTDAAVFLLDITTRYAFEKAFYEERRPARWRCPA